MNLIFKGNKLDCELEHELFSDSEFGFEVTIGFKMDAQNYANRVWRLNNVFEVHFKYKSIVLKEELGRVAFESNIHHTGRTNNIDDINFIIITEATELHSNMYQEVCINVDENNKLSIKVLEN